MYNKMYEACVITYSCTAMHIPDMLWSWGEVICVAITAVAMDVTFMMETQRYNENWSGEWLT